jgi:hypothetical protein
VKWLWERRPGVSVGNKQHCISIFCIQSTLEKRFPEYFMFQLKKEEPDEWKSQIVISIAEKMGLGKEGR